MELGVYFIGKGYTCSILASLPSVTVNFAGAKCICWIIFCQMYQIMHSRNDVLVEMKLSCLSELTSLVHNTCSLYVLL